MEFAWDGSARENEKKKKRRNLGRIDPEKISVLTPESERGRKHQRVQILMLPLSLSWNYKSLAESAR